MTHYYDKLKNIMSMEAGRADNQIAQPRYGRVESYDPKTNRVQCSLLPEKSITGEKIMTTWMHILTPWLGPGTYGDVCPLDIGDQVVMLPMYGSGSEYMVIGSGFNDPAPPAKGQNDIEGGEELTQIGERLFRSKSGMTMKFVDGRTLMIKGDYHKEEVLHIITKGIDVHITASDYVTVDCKDCNVNASHDITAKAKNNITARADNSIYASAGNNIQAEAGSNIEATAGSQATVTAPQITLNGEVQVNGNITCSGNVTDYAISMAGMRDLYNVHIHDDSPPPEPTMPG